MAGWPHRVDGIRPCRSTYSAWLAAFALGIGCGALIVSAARIYPATHTAPPTPRTETLGGASLKSSSRRKFLVDAGVGETERAGA